MYKGRISHHWDLFAPLICATINPWRKEKDQISPKELHPFWQKENKSAKMVTEKEFQEWLHGNKK